MFGHSLEMFSRTFRHQNSLPLYVYDVSFYRLLSDDLVSKTPPLKTNGIRPIYKDMPIPCTDRCILSSNNVEKLCWLTLHLECRTVD